MRAILLFLALNFLLTSVSFSFTGMSYKSLHTELLDSRLEILQN